MLISLDLECVLDFRLLNFLIFCVMEQVIP
jgi:hypothetical protein